ncbi:MULTISPECIES: TetR/AcrR family transcriptional regulator C-terminal domain-containing protein [unclassified Rhizobium]|uniref:TetR/AcrR family transcriptional regulator C-terminal domain-containing protein n=1 Tax=unclassified Rhizobium TaxID=2613769 RepID=UPI001607AD3F
MPNRPLPFHASCFDPGKALELQIAISRYVVGCALEEQADMAGSEDRAALDVAAESHPNLAKALALYRANGHDALFEAGLELLIGGAEAGKISSVTAQTASSAGECIISRP